MGEFLLPPSQVTFVRGKKVKKYSYFTPAIKMIKRYCLCTVVYKILLKLQSYFFHPLVIFIYSVLLLDTYIQIVCLCIIREKHHHHNNKMTKNVCFTRSSFVPHCTISFVNALSRNLIVSKFTFILFFFSYKNEQI